MQGIEVKEFCNIIKMINEKLSKDQYLALFLFDQLPKGKVDSITLSELKQLLLEDEMAEKQIPSKDSAKFEKEEKKEKNQPKEQQKGYYIFKTLGIVEKQLILRDII